MKQNFHTKDVFTAITADEAKRYISKFGYAGTTVAELIENINTDNKTILREIGGIDEYHRFRVGEYALCDFFLPEEKIIKTNKTSSNTSASSSETGSMFEEIKQVSSRSEFITCFRQAMRSRFDSEDIVGMKIFIRPKADQAEPLIKCCMITALSEYGVTFGGDYKIWEDLDKYVFSFFHRGEYRSFVIKSNYDEVSKTHDSGLWKYMPHILNIPDYSNVKKDFDAQEQKQFENMCDNSKKQ